MQWHCNDLIIVSGASGSGKSFFLKKLKKGNNSDFMISIFEEINASRQGLIKVESIKVESIPPPALLQSNTSSIPDLGSFEARP